MLAGRKRVGFIGEALCWQARRTGVCHKSSITGSQRRDIGKRLGQVDVGISRLVPHELARRDRRRRLARLRRGFARGREERSQLGEFRHAQRLYATDSRYASASSAAMQPVPALVTAWR